MGRHTHRSDKRVITTETMKPKLLTLLLLLGLCTSFSAQESCKAAQPFTPQHELRLTAGAYPLLWGFTPFTYGSRYYDSYRGPMYTSGAWSLAYDYRFKKWFDFGFYVSYWGKYGTTRSNVDNTLLSRDRLHRISVVPVVRFTWLNRPIVRLYTSIGMGVVFGGYKGNFDERASKASFTGQWTPLGIAVGKSFFGFAEIGVGSQGTLMAGIGYRFNNKKH